MISSKPVTVAPVTTLEELPLLDEAEKAALVAALAAAETDIVEGRYVIHDRERLVERLKTVRAQARHARST